MSSSFIRNINDIKNCGVFYGWPKGSIEFGRYTLVYGWNGSGKTTLSRILRSLEKENIDAALLCEETPSFQFKLHDGSLLNSNDMTGWKNKVRVFNRDFVQENINTDSAEAEPVYHLGKDQGDALQELQKVIAQLAIQTQNLETGQKSLAALERALDKDLTSVAKVIKNKITPMGFQAPKLREVLDKLKSENTDTNTMILTDADLAAVSAAALSKNEMSKESTLSLSCTVGLAVLYKSVDDICKTNIVKAFIEELDSNAPLKTWVETGIGLHEKKDTCAFCDGKITSDRLEKLNQYFNTAYKDLMSKIAVAKINQQSLSVAVKGVSPIDAARIYQPLRSAYEAAKATLIQAAADYATLLDALAGKLEEKKNSLTQAISLTELKEPQKQEQAFGAALKAVNQSVTQHNEYYDSFEQKKQEAREVIIQHHSAEQYAAYTKAIVDIEAQKQKNHPLETLVKELTEKQKTLETQLQQHGIAASTINELLASFLGRNDIKLHARDKGYVIEREGKKAENLSEGEKTAIAFVYFIAKLREQSFSLQDSIVVVDDPISSLDTNSLYAAGSFIRCHLEQAKQVFILTHNYQFFREMYGWIEKIKNNTNCIEGTCHKSYIMMRCEVDANGKRCAAPYKMDNILRQYDSEYVYLFKQLYEAQNKVQFKEDATPDQLSQLIQLPNLARRVMETFVLFKFPHERESSVTNLYNTIKTLGFTIATEEVSILDRLLNRGSHGDESSVASINMFNLSETPKVVTYVLKFIEHTDPVHFGSLKRAIGVKETPKNDDKVSPPEEKTASGS